MKRLAGRVTIYDRTHSQQNYLLYFINKLMSL